MLVRFIKDEVFLLQFYCIQVNAYVLRIGFYSFINGNLSNHDLLVADQVTIQILICNITSTGGSVEFLISFVEIYLNLS